jgi:hypothetical protein
VSIASLVILATARMGMAAHISIVDNDFTDPVLPNSAYSYAPNFGTDPGTWVGASGNDGVCLTSSYNPNISAAGSQIAFT